MPETDDDQPRLKSKGTPVLLTVIAVLIVAVIATLSSNVLEALPPETDPALEDENSVSVEPASEASAAGPLDQADTVLSQ